MRVVIAIDPGRDKCGLAVVSENGVLHKSIRPPEEIPEAVEDLIHSHSPETIVIGNGTHAEALAERLRADRSRLRWRLPDLAGDLPIVFTDESYTTLRARARFFQENPPRGLRRLIPRGMLAPDRPVDDLAAVILAEDFLAGK